MKETKKPPAGKRIFQTFAKWRKRKGDSKRSSRRIGRKRKSKEKRRQFKEIIDMRPGDNEWGSLRNSSQGDNL